MANAIINAFLKFVMGLASLLTAPIDALINTVLPDLSDAVMNIQSFFIMLSDVIGFCLDLVGFPPLALQLIITYFVFKYAIVGVASGVKKVITLWYVLKP